MKWLAEKLRELLLEYIQADLTSSKRGVEVFTLAQSVACPQLMEMCAGEFDQPFADMLAKDKALLSEICFSVMESLVESEFVTFEEKTLFEIVIEWLQSGRNVSVTQSSQLLAKIRFDLVDNEYLSETAFDKIIDLQNLTEDLRKGFLKKLREARKEASGKSAGGARACLSRKVDKSQVNTPAVVNQNEVRFDINTDPDLVAVKSFVQVQQNRGYNEYDGEEEYDEEEGTEDHRISIYGMFNEKYEYCSAQSKVFMLNYIRLNPDSKKGLRFG